MRFSDLQLKFMDYVEQIYLMEGYLPTYERCAPAVIGLSKNQYGTYLANPELLRELKTRGIELNPNAGGALTPQQLVCANTLLDLADKRSEKNKLKDMGISTLTYNAWKKDPAFKHYLITRSENILSDLTDVNLALKDVATRGDVSAIKLIYEMTGRWSSKTVGELNIEFFLGKIMEVIMRNVTDPATLARISEEMLQLTDGKPTNNPNSSVISSSGAVTEGKVIEHNVYSYRPPVEDF